MEVKTICCGKEMIEVVVQFCMWGNTVDFTRFVCSECGEFLDIHRYTLDDEELVNEVENYDELENTPIHKELLANEIS